MTADKRLQTVLTYAWGDYGTPPREAAFLTHALVMNHFWKCGGWYPVGGSSEIALNITPVIERSGGRVLVNADVTRIVFGRETIPRVAGVNVSKAGLFYTPSMHMFC